MPEHRARRWLLFALLLYIGLLALSTLKRQGVARVSTPSSQSVEVREVVGDHRTDKRAPMAYIEFKPDEAAAPPVSNLPSQPAAHLPVILLHGSPGHGTDFELLAPLLGQSRRMIAPDLPGFGRSTREIPDYSILAHADYVLQLMDALGIERAHLVGFSMGGGVALTLADLAPQRVASVTMLSSIGVQEMELLGEYHINHLIHGVQLAFLWSIRELIPHFGYLDNALFGVEYARNFYDTDQRPLRKILGRYRGPMLIVHGREDYLVPVQAALEHHRLVPQSDLRITPLDHFMVFLNPKAAAPTIAAFLDAVEAGTVATRETADLARILESEKPFDSSTVPKAVGVAAFVIFVLLAIGTLVSEDLTCIAAGLMVAQGRAGFFLVTAACVVGIFVGDLLLFAAGRYLGRPALGKAPLKWFIRSAAVDRSSAWFRRRGAAVILASRFFPGMRLPTYFAAGVLDTSILKFSGYFLMACLVWTPLLVGASMLFGGELTRRLLSDRVNLFPRVALAIGATLVVIRLITRLATRRGRRLLLGTWRRLRHWEFWPPVVFYAPVVIYIIWLMIRYRSVTLFTLANPAIPEGGFIGESKTEILNGLSGASGAVARFRLMPAKLPVPARTAIALTFMADERLTFPVVLKPDAGQRGAGVEIVRSEAHLESYLNSARTDSIVQEFVPGEEYGVFYYRLPGEAQGRLLAITEKRLPVLTGDGRRNLEALILDDDRTVSMARFFLAQEEDRLEWVPNEGEVVRLVELGTHCRGAVFLDGERFRTDALERRVDEISQTYRGFFFGRYDLKVDSAADLSAGRGLRVIELNGVTSEATSIYDPKNRIAKAYSLLFRQWRIAFEIGAQNRGLGLKPTPLRGVVRAMLKYRQATDRES
ncbi:MAG: alpha/beta fold hydrolase [Acidobacteriota bacterium]